MNISLHFSDCILCKSLGIYSIFFRSYKMLYHRHTTTDLFYIFRSYKMLYHRHTTTDLKALTKNCL